MAFPGSKQYASADIDEGDDTWGVTYGNPVSIRAHNSTSDQTCNYSYQLSNKKEVQYFLLVIMNGFSLLSWEMGKGHLLA